MATVPTHVRTFGDMSEFDAVPDRTGSDESDAELTARFVRDAVPLLDVLYGGARPMTLNRSDAEDLVQDTMVRAYSQFRLFREGTHLKAWLMRIMHNTWINNHRKRQSRPMEQLTDEIADWQNAAGQRDAPLGDRSAEIEALEGLPDDEIIGAVEALPETLRMVVYYADVVGYRYREIAEIMGTPLGTVMSRLQHARQRLRILLADVAAQRGLGQKRASRSRPASMILSARPFGFEKRSSCPPGIWTNRCSPSRLVILGCQPHSPGGSAMSSLPSR